MDVYRGAVVHCLRPDKMEVLPDHLIGVENGQVFIHYQLFAVGKVRTVAPVENTKRINTFESIDGDAAHALSPRLIAAIYTRAECYVIALTLLCSIMYSYSCYHTLSIAANITIHPVHTSLLSLHVQGRLCACGCWQHYLFCLC